MFDILVAGELNPDLILSGEVTPEFGQVEKLVDSAWLTIGSSSAIFACAATRLGLGVVFIGTCGDDVFGHFMLEQLQARGVDTSNVIIDSNGQTGLSVILNRGDDRAILTHCGLIGALRAEQVTTDLLRQARHLHVASYFLQSALRPGLPDLFNRAHAAGLTTSLDTNWDPSGGWLGFRQLLPLVDIFLPNQNEALTISGAEKLEDALHSLAQECPVVAVKCGKGGAYAIQAGNIVYAPAIAVQVVDAIGAGDNFDAGFLCGWLDGWNLEKSLQLATACGSLSTRAAGGVSAQPILQEAMNYVQCSG
jgi:sugar/nucleoside kinase (ribokinase family)